MVNQRNYGLIMENTFTIHLRKNGQTIKILSHNVGKLVIAKRFINTLMSKIYKKITANDIKSNRSYLNKLADQYNNTFHHSINKKPMTAVYSDLTENIETNPKNDFNALKAEVVKLDINKMVNVPTGVNNLV